MKATIEDKLDKIADIWNYFIWDYKFCSKKIKFNEDVQTNYFGDILGYFRDTLDIVFTDRKHSNYTDKFSFTISFLQAIYIQQDFTQEMLEIFRTEIDKGKLKQDLNYTINRDLRNELIGHPIRKIEIATEDFVTKECDSCGKLLNKPKKKLALLSSTLFSYQSKEDEIQYLRYHKNNNFKVEIMSYKISDIQERHKLYLEKYFDIILGKLKTILDEHFLEIDKLETVIKTSDLPTVLRLIELYFEAFFKYDFIYDKESMLIIYERKNQHIRYQNFIDRFYRDLSSSLKEKRASAKTALENKVISQSYLEKPLFDSGIQYSIPKISSNNNIISQEITYHYELGKIATKRNSEDFDFFGGILKSKCKDNKLVLNELINMELNINNEIEYYTSLRLICTELKED